jgi:hypothetical protein
MKNKAFKILIAIVLTSFVSCAQNNTVVETEKSEAVEANTELFKKEKHRYGGWYCPDNLNGFPAVDITNWKNVPVVNGRMATKEETENGTSLIFVDTEKYPNAKPLDMTMPRLAKYYNEYSKREDFIIIIQAVNIDNDSIVGFRFVNGGNGSARLNEVNLLSDSEINAIPETQFVSIKMDINASQSQIWDVLTKAESTKELQSTFDKNNSLKADWKSKSNVNFRYSNSGMLTSDFADILWGNFYIQNDYEYLKYSEKFFLSTNEDTKITELKIVCGPFIEDFEKQTTIINEWARKVKSLSEAK